MRSRAHRPYTDSELDALPLRGKTYMLLAVGTAIAGGAWYALAQPKAAPEASSRAVVHVVSGALPRPARLEGTRSGPNVAPVVPTRADMAATPIRIPTAIEVGSEERGNYM